jgi:epoxyqueuosine reductase
LDRISSQSIKEKALELGFDQAGVCAALPVAEASKFYRRWLQAGFGADMEYLANHEAVKTDPRHLLASTKSVIVVSLNYFQEQPDGLPGRIARYAIGRDYHKVIPSKLRKLVRRIEEDHPASEHRICVDSAPLLDRAYASLAGLGWFGKNTMLIDSKRGSWFFIGLVLSSVSFERDKPSLGGCGTCRACIDACPTGAIVQLGDRWAVDSRQCISYQTIENKAELGTDTHGWLFGCDICQEVCPFNQRREAQPMRGCLTKEDEFLTPSRIVQNLRTGEVDWELDSRGSPIRRVGEQGLIRNLHALNSE